MLPNAKVWNGSEWVGWTDTPSPDVWWDFSDTSTITDTSGTITSVADKSGNGFTLTGSSNVFTGIDTINGLNVATFDLGHLVYSGSTGMTPVLSALIVFEQLVNTANAGILTGMPTSGNDYNSSSGFAMNAGGGSFRFVFHANNSGAESGIGGSGSVPLGLYLGMSTGGTTLSALANGTAYGTMGQGASATIGGGWLLGKRYLSGGIAGTNRLEGLIGEIRIFSGVQSFSGLSRHMVEMANKWGL